MPARGRVLSTPTKGVLGGYRLRPESCVGPVGLTACPSRYASPSTFRPPPRGCRRGQCWRQDRPRCCGLGSSGGQRGYIIITPRVQNGRDTCDTIRHVVVPV